MKTREDLRKQLIENRLMRNFEETELFEEAMNKLYEENNLENINTIVKLLMIAQGIMK